MASRRILISPGRYTATLVVALGIFVSACGTSKKATPPPRSPSGKKTSANKSSTGLSQQFIAVLKNDRSKLSDAYATLNNNIPDFLASNSTTRDIGNPSRGYRIQILSTMNLPQADSVAKNFRSWVDSTMQGYIPKAYVLYKQPYYKIHIGNFQFQEQASKLNRLLKNRYPGAWVVNDNVDPELVPPDTTTFKMDHHQ